MTSQDQTISRWYSIIRRHSAKPASVFGALLALWFFLLAVFYVFPGLDLAVARSFFTQAACAPMVEAGRICGSFLFGEDPFLIVVRRVLFYLPSGVAIFLLYRLIANLQHAGATYNPRKTRDYSIAILSFLVGPYVLVNLILKQISHRPRPYETDLFGGNFPFMPAGDFGGACVGNCSFISGEGAAAGWLACLIVLLPPRLRVVVGVPMIIVAVYSAALRMSFGGHYFSDITLAFLSSIIVYAGIAACFEMSQKERNRRLPTNL